MIETFRLSRALRHQGLAVVVFFAALTIAFATLPLYVRTGEHGVEREGSVVGMALLGVGVSGLMLALGVYTLAAYYVEQFSVDGSSITVRSVFQNRRFHADDVTEVRWNERRPRIVFRMPDCKAVLDLGGFERADRLRIVRIVRALFAEATQQGWPLYCLRVAVPLRDGISSIELIHSVKSPGDPSGFVLVTRQRYDRVLMVALPASVAVSLFAWWLTDRWQIMVAPPGAVVFWWLLLRFSTPRQGQRQATVRANGIGPLLWFAIASMGLVIGLLIALPRMGAPPQTENVILGVLGAICFSILPALAYRMDRRQQSDAEAAAAVAERYWAEGEMTAPRD
jgi:predicted outer membrane lipoprotein